MEQDKEICNLNEESSGRFRRKIIDQLWKMTWDECLEAYRKGATLVTSQGYLLAGRDWKIDDDYSRATARQMYLDNLRIADKKGREIPDAVRKAHAEDIQWRAV